MIRGVSRPTAQLLSNGTTTTTTRRGFVIASLAAITQSSWLKGIRQADEISDVSSPLVRPETPVTPIKFSEKLPDGRILISPAERAVLFVVSGLSALIHPEIGANIVNFGEVSAIEPILKSLRDQMLQTDSGRRILRERPQLKCENLNQEWLKTLPENTLGYRYYRFTKDNDARSPVKFIADEELAYVFLRYRQMHDIVHILTEHKVDLAGELPVKAFEFGNTGLPMTGLACFAYFKLSAKRKKRVHMMDSFLEGLQSTPLLTVEWEKVMDRDLNELRRELGITA